MNGQDLRKLVESHGSEAVVQRIVPLLWSQDPRERISPEQFSVREAWEAFVGPVESTLAVSRAAGRRGFVNQPLIEAQQSSAFSILTGNVIAARIQQAYSEIPSTLDRLVGTPMKSSMRTERFAGSTAIGGVKDVPEGQDYPEVGFTDKGVEAPEPNKRGLQISLTDETIAFDQTGQILVQARNIGRAMKTDRERTGMYQIQDLTNYTCYYPLVNGKSPTQTALFRSSAGGTDWYNKTINLKTSNALVDWTDVDNAFGLYSDMVDEAGDPILVQANTILVPRALFATALRIVGATSVQMNTGTPSGSGVVPPVVTVSPDILRLLAEAGGSLIPLTSPFMNDTTTWYVGDFQAQYVEQEIFPIQTVELPPDQRKDIITGFRARRKSRIVAIDDKFVIKNTA